MKKHFFLFTFIFSVTLCAQKIPKGFVYLSNIDATIQSELRYLGNNNFIGKTIDGYYSHCVIVSKETADALKKVPKSELFKRGYIASKSSHTRGSTVDLTIIDTKTKNEVDMGSPYDFFGIESHPYDNKINLQQQKNRLYLRKIMLDNNFKPYDQEWWHFTLRNEPFPKTYFNFPIKK